MSLQELFLRFMKLSLYDISCQMIFSLKKKTKNKNNAENKPPRLVKVHFKEKDLKALHLSA